MCKALDAQSNEEFATKEYFLSFGAFYSGGLKSLSRLTGDVRDVAVQLLLSSLLIITLSCDSQSHSVRNSLNTHSPDFLVQLRVEADVLGAHVLCRELLDSLDCPRCPLLELHAVYMLV